MQMHGSRVTVAEEVALLPYPESEVRGRDAVIKSRERSNSPSSASGAGGAMKRWSRKLIGGGGA